MRNYDDQRTTTDNYVYKRLAIYSQLGCPICGPNKGCNRNSKRKAYGSSMTWKAKKMKKQWMKHL